MASTKHELIPAWDGEGRSFLEFAEQCKLLQRATKIDQRQLLAAKVVQKLSGPARTIALQQLDKFEHQSGLEDLLALLEQSIGRPRVSVGAYELESLLSQVRLRNSQGVSLFNLLGFRMSSSVYSQA